MFFGKKKESAATEAAKTADAQAEPVGAGGRPVFTEKDKATAKQWFKKGADCREKRDYDYAIESYITGLGSWPEAVQEGHMPLRSIAIQRLQAGGQKPGMMKKMQHPTGGKDAKVAMLNAEWLVAMDPTDEGAWDALVKNATKGGFVETVKWAAPLGIESLKRDKKPNPTRFRAFRDLMVEASDVASASQDTPSATALLTFAVDSLDFLISRNPTDDALRDEQRNLAGKLAIAKGKYEDAATFRESLNDAAAQKVLQDLERGAKQTDATLTATLDKLRSDWEKEPLSSGAINRYIDALQKTETKKYEDEAVRVLSQLHEQTHQYNFKVRADNIALAQRKREVRAQIEQARGGDDGQKQQARLAAQEYTYLELDVYRERMQKYPTDLQIKYRVGSLLFEVGDYHEAIPILQDAQADPKVRHRALLKMGRAFHETGAFAQAADVLREALDSYELTDETSKELMYRLGMALQAAGRIEDAKTIYSKLLRLDYNYSDGDVRKRLEELK